MSALVAWVQCISPTCRGRWPISHLLADLDAGQVSSSRCPRCRHVTTYSATIEGGEIIIDYRPERMPEECDVVICHRKGPSRFTDNLEGHCALCGAEIMFRPYAPTTPPKWCVECARAHAEVSKQ